MVSLSHPFIIDIFGGKVFTKRKVYTKGTYKKYIQKEVYTKKGILFQYSNHKSVCEAYTKLWVYPYTVFVLFYGYRIRNGLGTARCFD